MREERVCNFVGVLGCDLADGGSTLGPETLARCGIALERVEQFRKFHRRTEVVLSAGFANKNRYPRQTKTMAMMMAEWFIANNVPKRDIFVEPDPHIWGTRAELRSILQRLRVHPFVNSAELVSSSYHAPRIKLVADRIGKSEQVYLIFGYSTYVTEFPSPLNKLEYYKYVAEYLIGLVRPNWYRFRQNLSH